MSVSMASGSGDSLRRTRSTGDVASPRSSPGLGLLRSLSSRRLSEGQAPCESGDLEHPSLSITPLGSNSRDFSPISVPQNALLRAQSNFTARDVPLVETPVPNPEAPENTDGPDREPNQHPANPILKFIGLEGPNAKARRELLSLIWNLGFGFIQFVVVITMLVYSAHHESPTDPGLSEWKACNKPLGVWDSIWLVRVALGCFLSVWGWQRQRAVRQIQERRQRGNDPETPRPTMSPRQLSAIGSTGPTPRSLRSPSVGAAGQSPPGSEPNPTVNLAHTVLFARLTLLGTFMSLAWFLTAHILEYTTVNDCRFTSPHLWWLTFGILCILYIMILEIFLLGLLVFVLGPVLYLLWNIVLLCIGRHPLQNPHYIKPDIGKLSKSVVDDIPLVLYIPPPPDETPDGTAALSPIPVPPTAHSYPPKPKRSTTAPAPKRRFAFMRKVVPHRAKKSKSDLGDSSEKTGTHTLKRANVDPEKMTWEDRWEPGEHPFVRLEGNRAVCAICLLDFEEPRRADGVLSNETPTAPTVASADEVVQNKEIVPTQKDAASGEEAEEILVEEVSQEERDRLKLDDAGEGAQPLRLLFCGHVFHQTCVDPWLTEVSGRCPVCQRAVEFPESGGKKKKQRQPSS
ncbi:uncharacterized protein FIBRA_03520 [Fibroporia radiculosa]|uniref:RING-type E3 ubiquitin transferase n=1 Tax=Fibroporia radiculosa TaxID=599839 RepID=J4I9N4_9APHY|nr:uncharacterized protein FIBRA_03520 [Fibroporia radiculosa]CCM01466.1 predicted protein [Fibroporia radiculosa]